MPLVAILFSIVAVPLVVFFAIRGFRSDRMDFVKHRDYGDTKWVGMAGNLTSCEMIDIVGFSGKGSLDIAESAMKALDGKRIERGENVVLGWAPFVFPYPAMQMGVRVTNLPNNVTRYECSSRPRYSTALSDFGRSRQLAARLNDQIVSSK